MATKAKTQDEILSEALGKASTLEEVTNIAKQAIAAVKESSLFVSELTDVKGFLTADLTKVTTANKELEGKLETLEAEKKDLEVKLEASITEKNNIAIKAADEIRKLSEQLSTAASDSEDGRPSVTVDGQKYFIIGKVFSLDGRTLTAAMIKSDLKLVKELIKKGVGFLVKAEK